MTWLQVLVPVASALFAAGGAWAAVRVELAWLRRDVDRVDERLQRVELACQLQHRRRGA